MICDLNFQLGSSITEHQSSSLMTYLNDFKIFLEDVLSEFLLAGKLDSQVQSKIKDILQVQTAYIAEHSNQSESPADPRNRDLKCCKEFKILNFNPLAKNVPIPWFNQKLYKKLRYKFKTDFDLLDSRMWSSVREQLESQEVADFDVASELSIDEHEMNQLLGSDLAPVEDGVKMTFDASGIDSVSPGHSLPKTPVFKPNLSIFSDGFSFIEPSIHTFENIHSVPVTPVFNLKVETLIAENFSDEFSKKDLSQDKNDYYLIQEISHFVIKPLMDNIEKMFVKQSNF